MSDKLAMVLFSGSVDKLHAAATIASGAAAMGVETHVFLTFWGLDAFRKASIEGMPPMSSEAGDRAEAVAKLMADKGVPPWQEVLRQAHELGDVHVHACAASMEIFELGSEDLDPLVEDTIGVASFMGKAEGAQLLFI